MVGEPVHGVILGLHHASEWVEIDDRPLFDALAGRGLETEDEDERSHSRSFGNSGKIA
jgi:hypothetical protein